MKKGNKRRVVAVALAAALFAFMGVSYALQRAGRTNPVTQCVQTLFAPLQRGVTKGSLAMRAWMDAWVNGKRYLEENQRLKREASAQEQALMQAESIKKENERLRALLTLREGNPQFEMIGCEIIAKNDGDQFFTLQVDKGAESGIKKGDVAVTEQGLVGKVTAAGKNWAQITTILHPESVVGVRVVRTETIALAQGHFLEGNQNALILSPVLEGALPVAGDVIETSGLGGGYPKGLLVGVAEEIKRNAAQNQDFVIVRPMVEFQKLHAVMIIKM